jgi:hypothetical protein
VADSLGSRHYSLGIVNRLHLFILPWALAAATPFAQPAAAPAACPRAAETGQPHLIGLWRAEFDGLPRGASVLMEKHPDDEGRVSGAINRDGARSRLAGDVHRGEFSMEESADGTHISGVWTGDVVEGSCGREIRGVWQEEKDPPQPYPFVLRKQAAW